MEIGRFAETMKDGVKKQRGKDTKCTASVSKMKNPRVDMIQFLNYKNVSKSIVYKLINTERNSELLEDIPHINFLDLSIVFQCMLVSDEHKIAYILVHNAHLKLWDVTVDDLYKTANGNTPKLMGYIQCFFRISVIN